MQFTLEPCPFCDADGWSLGVESVVEESRGETKIKYYAVCDVCNAEGPLCASRKEAAEEWNGARRKSDEDNKTS